MLPRGVDLVRLLHLRQRLVSCSLNTNALLNGAQIQRKLLLDLKHQNCLSKTLFCNRTYCSKKSKVLAAPTKPSSNSADNVTTKTKTTKNTATEPKSIAANSENATAKASTAQHTATTTPTKTQTKKLKVETSKGVLSVTTTIEDSKINDIIFEKTKSISRKTSKQQQDAIIPAAKLSAEDVVKDIKAATASVAAAVASAVKPTPKVDTTTAAAKVEPKTVAATQSAAAVTQTSSDTVAANAQAAPILAAAVGIAQKPARVKVDINRSSLERNFITPARAMSDFLLKASDLDSLSKIKRRSPYEQEPPITVYWRKDVEAKGIEVWGSRENLLRERLTREIERKKHQQNIFTVKRRLRDYRREIGSRAVVLDDEPGLRGKSGKVVLIAIGINAINFLFKVCGWLYTGSHSMFAEAIHSLADTINQLILAYGIHKSTQMADPDHPYGYSNMKYVSSLISGVGIFCVGTGVSYYHGITGLMHPEPLQDFFWAFFILGGSLVSEGATLLVAVNEVRRSAKLQGVSFKDYVWSGKDPCVNVVLTEDAAAVTSVAVAAACMGLTSLTGSAAFDSIGSLLVGSILGGVASFIIYTNVAALVGKSIAQEHLEKINAELESDIMIRAIHDVKGIDMGNSLVRYKAEMDFDGRELTRFYLDKQDLNELLKVVKSFQTVEELEAFLLKHGENIVDLMGGEIDRIEMKLRKKFPEIRHCDLEIL